MKLIYTIFVVSFLWSSISSSGQIETGGMLERLNLAAKSNNTFKVKQKVLLHTDKNLYNAGENIWFKAYVRSGELLLADTLSKNLYIELWSPEGNRVYIGRTKLEKGIGAGQIAVTDTFPQGIYQLRAYTDLLINFSAEYFFSRNLAIKNENHTYIISPEQAKKNKKKLKQISKAKEKFELAYFIDGGNLIENEINKIYFRATNIFGDLNGVKVKIIDSDKNIVDEKDNESGIGTLMFKPNNETKYFLVADFNNGEHKKYSLPDSKNEGIQVKVVQEKNIRLHLSKPFITSTDPSANRYFIIGHLNNYIYTINVVDLRHDTVLCIDKDVFPSGIINFTVLSNRKEWISNYKIYKTAEFVKQFSINANKKADSVLIEINSKNTITSGNYSISFVVYDSLPISDFDMNRDFFLSSDLNGIVSFSKKEYSSIEIEELVNTMSNSVPDWESLLLTGSKLQKDFIPENRVEVVGKITSEVFDIPIKNANVRLEILDRYNDVFSTVTDNKGKFKFEGFDFYDTLAMKIIARKSNGRKGVLIHLEDSPVPPLKKYNGDFFLTTTSLRDKKGHRKEVAQIANKEASEKEKELNEFYSTVIHGRPDNIIYAEDLPRSSSILEAVKGRVAGLNIVGDEVNIRGANSIYGSSEPLVLIDGVPANIQALKSMPLEDVERIEIIKGASAAVYGIRGGNGVIAVYTKRGEFMIKGELDFSLLGYNFPVSFSVSDKQNTQSASHYPDTYLWVADFEENENQKFALPVWLFRGHKFLLIKIEGFTNIGELVTQSEVFTF